MQITPPLPISKNFRLSLTEWIGIIPVDPFGRLGKFYCIEQSEEDSFVMFEPKALFKAVFLYARDGFILCHNHPSGNTEASSLDLRLTQQVEQAAQLLNIPFYGHYVVSANQDQRIILTRTPEASRLMH